MLQSYVLVASPAQMTPPFAGCGLMQVRIWVIFPPPQVALQMPTDSQSVKLPFLAVIHHWLQSQVICYKIAITIFKLECILLGNSVPGKVVYDITKCEHCHLEDGRSWKLRRIYNISEIFCQHPFHYTLIAKYLLPRSPKPLALC